MTRTNLKVIQSGKRGSKWKKIGQTLTNVQLGGDGYVGFFMPPSTFVYIWIFLCVYMNYSIKQRKLLKYKKKKSPSYSAF